MLTITLNTILICVGVAYKLCLLTKDLTHILLLYNIFKLHVHNANNTIFVGLKVYTILK